MEITDEKYLEFLKMEATLQALKSGGVDNWDGYGEAILNWEENYGPIEAIKIIELKDPLYESTLNPSVLYKYSQEEEIFRKINEKIFEFHPFDRTDYGLNIQIKGEFSKEDRDKVAEKLMKDGWNKIEHRTSSENGERPGLTSFYFYHKNQE